MLSLALCLTLLSPQGSGIADHVVINEFTYDTDGFMPDLNEFVELYNPTGLPVDISGWVLDSEDAFGPNTAYAIPGTPGSMTTVIPAGGFYVLGSRVVPRVTQSVGTSDLWENGSTGSGESLTLRDDQGTIIDTVVYESNKGVWDPNLVEGEGCWGNHRSLSANGLDTGWARIRDGWDTDNNGMDFVNIAVTPGLSNNLGVALYAADYNALYNEQPLPEFNGAFEYAHAVDVTFPGNINTYGIPVSPDGGNAAIFGWDYLSGGGNINMLLSEVTSNAVFEAWVYFESTTVPAGEIDTWSIGIGTSASFANHPDPGGSMGFTANGNVGVSWIFQRTDSSTELYLVDHNDGGWGAGALSTATLVGQITIQAGVNDGWRRLRLERNGGKILGSFDGSPGCANGTSFAAPFGQTVPATWYASYREGLTDNSLARPPTMDDVSVLPATSAVSFIGTAVPTSAGTPTLDVNAPPSIGLRNWEIQLSGLVPSQVTFLFLGTQLQQIPLSGTPPGVVLQFIPIVGLPLPTDGAGTTSTSFGIRCSPGLVGLPLYWQALDFDGSLPFSLPVGTSQAMETRFGS